MTDRSKWLVSTEWLETNLDNPDIAILDGSWYLAHMNRDPEKEYVEAHIPGALFFDIDKIADLSHDLPHMLPPTVVLDQAMTDMGVRDGQKIVIYDGAGLMIAPRLWWTLHVMGVKDVVILDGGFPKWVAENRPTTNAKTIRPQGSFSSTDGSASVSDFDDILKAIDDEDIQIVDARSEERWRGLAPEPRPHLSSGRMPGSRNVPFADLVDETGCFKDSDYIRQRFIDAGVDLDKPIITTCGSGGTAAMLSFALDILGCKDVSLYDGAWMEYAAKEGVIIEKDV
ncbi:3-mercaptopyruvate sulfurtransferase [uncultured Cohaesibacter sp.]|uniref:3-mercaptopyruvate sulfurtransferase n=1 Tax=uncultured Cohaesibacter sp. TaxID=1002546 RepID=UPI00292F49A5|nr:3-mercaptopyruvate sulfurtransferase [uncultured Cohaesibacter sp.]